MNLQALLKSPSAPAVELVGLAEHSAEVAADFGFIGVAADAAVLKAHCRAAVDAGARAVLCDAAAEAPDLGEVPVIQVESLAAKRGTLAADFYADPSAALTCIGVTGTNGKTSVAYHLADLATRLGRPTGYSGTLGWGDLQRLQQGNMTTANAVALQRQLADMRDQGLVAVALEVSSHALAQQRADAVHFDYAVFTNLTRDHLDYHGTFAAYGEAKRRLFTDWPLQAAVINVEDEFGARLVARCAMPVITYGRGGDWSWRAQAEGAGLRIEWATPHGRFDAWLPLFADYAIANVTAAMATLVAVGHQPESVFDCVQEMRAVPGRMEVMASAAHQPTVVVDYAHTPDALAKALQALAGFCSGRLICVIGCGGDRDKGKRPQMAAAAVAGADSVWLTSDNPRSEDPQHIIDDMRAGITAPGSTELNDCVDRSKAITGAVRAAGAGDVILVAGKGHEDYQEISGQRLPFDDRLVAADVLRRMGGKS